MSANRNARDDAIVLAALPGDGNVIVDCLASRGYREEVKFSGMHVVLSAASRSIARLKRAGKVRYVREMKRWERVIEL